ncbi:LLM class flavin-dependent oxidoreductase [Streptomyces coeruleorubidus]|uniref:LLM class flavin-dependent oxidoreductase n=1 Tax=Streptomyces coeruleorubidus TaxID=116188 RepID=UPI0033D86CF8
MSQAYRYSHFGVPLRFFVGSCAWRHQGNAFSFGGASHRMTTHSVFLPFMPSRPEQIVPFAAFVQRSAAGRLWQGQALALDSHQLFSYAAGMGFRVPVGFGVNLMPFSHPLEAALQARSLAAVTGHPLVAGFGPGAAGLQRSMLGSAYASPLTAAREYLSVMRALLQGEPIRQDGTYHTLHAVNLAPVHAPAVELGLGVLRPGMARLAGEVADVAITWLTPPSYLREQLLPALREGAEKAGRPTPRVVTLVPVALKRADRDPVEMVLHGNSAHLQLPHYVDTLRRAGVEVDATDTAAGARTLVDSGVFAYGTPSSIADVLREYEDVGVDELVVNMTGACKRYGPRVALEDLDALFTELAG